MRPQGCGEAGKEREDPLSSEDWGKATVCGRAQGRTGRWARTVKRNNKNKCRLENALIKLIFGMLI